MLYQGVILLLMLLLKSCLTEKSGYNCFDFHDNAGRPLEECPPAKFMLKDHLVECFDRHSKSDGRLSFSPPCSAFILVIYKNLSLNLPNQFSRQGFKSVLVLE